METNELEGVWAGPNELVCGRGLMKCGVCVGTDEAECFYPPL